MLKNLLPSKPGTEPLAEALKACKTHFIWAFVFSALVNLLYLTPTLYMMQVFDRVISSRSVETLGYLTLIAFLALVASILLQILTNLQNDVGYTKRGAETASRIGLPQRSMRSRTRRLCARKSNGHVIVSFTRPSRTKISVACARLMRP